MAHTNSRGKYRLPTFWRPRSSLRCRASSFGRNADTSSPVADGAASGVDELEVVASLAAFGNLDGDDRGEQGADIVVQGRGLRSSGRAVWRRLACK
jgi:hypothetical protein